MSRGEQDPLAVLRWDLAWRRWYAATTFGATPFLNEAMARLDASLAAEARDSLRFGEAGEPQAARAQAEPADRAA